MMTEKTTSFPQVTVPVTEEEFNQFLNDHTYLPSCMIIDNNGLFSCRGNCPTGLVNVRFIYTDSEHNLQAEWYACAPVEEYEKLAVRAIPSSETKPPRNVKYIAYAL
ncbi:MAG TPA: hypothetical protein EYP41_15500 [Anaerolineae bacterium]|nr:hypothetical protein [Anaerolineae bacterium]